MIGLSQDMRGVSLDVGGVAHAPERVYGICTDEGVGVLEGCGGPPDALRAQDDPRNEPMVPEKNLLIRCSLVIYSSPYLCLIAQPFGLFLNSLTPAIRLHLPETPKHVGTN